MNTSIKLICNSQLNRNGLTRFNYYIGWFFWNYSFQSIPDLINEMHTFLLQIQILNSLIIPWRSDGEFHSTFYLGETWPPKFGSTFLGLWGIPKKYTYPQNFVKKIDFHEWYVKLEVPLRWSICFLSRVKTDQRCQCGRANRPQLDTLGHAQQSCSNF